jgi:hypothetical protein
MPVSSANVIARASKVLYDETNDRWAFIEHLKNMNAGVADIVQLDPKASMMNVPFLCAAGALQNLPGDAVALVDIPFNTNSSGVPGYGIREADFETFRRGRPNWAQQPPSTRTRNYMADPNDPKRFYVSPPQPAVPGYIQLVYQQVPDDATAVQLYTTGVANAGQAVIPMTNTAGVTVGMWCDPVPFGQLTGGPVVPATTVLSIVAGVSVTLSNNIQQYNIPSGTLLTFSDKFPLPDLYAEAAYLFIVYQAYQRRGKDGDMQMAQAFYLEYMKNLDQDVKNIRLIQAGHTNPAQPRG